MDKYSTDYPIEHLTHLSMEWKRELAKELLAPRPQKFPRRKVYASKANEIWTTDLMDVHRYAAVNKGMTFIVIVLDVFSRFAYARGVKNKTGKVVAKALSEILRESGTSPEFMWSDAGTEYYNHNVHSLLTRHNVKLYSTYNTIKASIAERFIRTLRTLIEREYILTDSTVWYKCLPRLIHEYNTRKHRTIKMSPLQALEPENEAAVYATQFQGSTGGTRPAFYIGQRVRTSLNKKLFEKGSTQNWTEEIFRISDIIPGQPTTYQLEDLLGEKVTGGFYKEQLRPTKQSIYRVERVLTRRRGQALVKWADYDERFNSWIDEANIHRGGNGNRGGQQGDERPQN